MENIGTQRMCKSFFLCKDTRSMKRISYNLKQMFTDVVSVVSDVPLYVHDVCAGDGGDGMVYVYKSHILCCMRQIIYVFSLNTFFSIYDCFVKFLHTVCSV